MKKKLHPAVVRLGWVSFFTDVSSEMIFPLLPAFLTGVLGASAFALGLIEGVSETTSSLFKLISGRWSDRLGRRRIFVLTGYGISSLMRSLIALAPHWLVILGLRFGDRVGKGLRTAPRDALIADAVPDHTHGRAYGFHRMMDHTGAVVGSLIGAALFWLWPGEFRRVFGLAAIPALMACVILFSSRALAEIRQIFKNGQSPSVKLSGRRMSKPARRFLFLVFIFNLGCASDAFFLLRLQDGGVPLVLLPVVWAAFHVVKALSTEHLGRLSDRMGYGRFIAAGWCLYGLIYALFSLSWSMPQLLALFLIYGFFYGLTEGPERALLAEMSQHENRGAIFGAYHFLTGLSLLPASVIFGALWQGGGPELAFRVVALITWVATLGLVFWLWRRRADEVV